MNKADIIYREYLLPKKVLVPRCFQQGRKIEVSMARIVGVEAKLK